MSSFKQLQPKRIATPALASTTSSQLRPSRTLANVSTPVFEPPAPVTQAELEHTALPGFSIAHIPIFAPVSHGSGTQGQGELAQEKSEPAQNEENITRLSDDLKSGVKSLPQFPIQAKLVIGAAHNQYEREADQMAEQVMRMNAAQANETAPQNTKQAEEEELKLRKEPEIQRAGADADFEASPDFVGRIANSKGAGSPLPDSIRAFMEPRFGADFSRVRLHTDEQSAQLNRAVNARAFTLGHEIFLGEGKINLATSEGKRLLAHELTHTIQQGAVPRRIHARMQQKQTLQDKRDAIPEEDIVPSELEKMGVLGSRLKERKQQQLSGIIGPKAIIRGNIATGLVVQRTIWVFKNGKWSPLQNTNQPAPKKTGKEQEGDTYDDVTHTYTKAPKVEEWESQQGEFNLRGNVKNAREDLVALLGTKPVLHTSKIGTLCGGSKRYKDILHDTDARIDVQMPPGKGCYNVQYQIGEESVCGIMFTDEDDEATLHKMLLTAFDKKCFMVSPSYKKLREEKKKKK